MHRRSSTEEPAVTFPTWASISQALCICLSIPYLQLHFGFLLVGLQRSDIDMVFLVHSKICVDNLLAVFAFLRAQQAYFGGLGNPISIEFVEGALTVIESSYALIVFAGFRDQLVLPDLEDLGLIL